MSSEEERNKKGDQITATKTVLCRKKRVNSYIPRANSEREKNINTLSNRERKSERDRENAGGDGGGDIWAARWNSRVRHARSLAIEMQGGLARSEENPHERWITRARADQACIACESIDIFPCLSTMSAIGTTVFP